MVSSYLYKPNYYFLSVLCRGNAFYYNHSNYCKCPVELSMAYVELATYIVRAASLPIFILTLIINHLTTKKWTTYLIFFQCHIVAYFFFYSASTIRWILEYKCSYAVLAMDWVNEYFFHCVFFFLAMMSVDMYLTFYIMDTKHANVAVTLQKYL